MRSTGRAKNTSIVRVLTVDLAGAGLDPDAGDGVLALAGGIGAALLVELLDVGRICSGGGRLELRQACRGTEWSRP